MQNNYTIFDQYKKPKNLNKYQKILIEPFKKQDNEEVYQLISNNIKPFLNSNSMLAGTSRRLDNLDKSYNNQGCKLLIARYFHSFSSEIVGCIGLGPLHGLAPSEGFGEIHDFLVKPEFRKQGIGSKLLNNCLNLTIIFKYKKLYLETTKSMAPACSLFLRSGFKPVTSKTTRKNHRNLPLNNKTLEGADEIPCYFLLEKPNN